MIAVPTGVRVWLATGHTDMRKGFGGLALLVQETLKRDPHSGNLFVFRGRRGDLIKVLWYDGQGLCLFSKRIDRGRFLWPSPADGTVSITTAQLGYLLEGIDWRNPQQTWRQSRPDEQQSLATQRVRGTLKAWQITPIRFPPVWLTLTR